MPNQIRSIEMMASSKASFIKKKNSENSKKKIVNFEM